MAAINARPANPRFPGSRMAIPPEQPGQTLLRIHRLDRRWRWCGGGDVESYPGIPAGGPVFASEFPIRLEIEISLQLVAERKDVADLRADADDLRLEATDAIAGSAVAADLLVDIADEADLPLLGEKLRSTPVEVHVDAILVLRRRVDEIVGEAERAGKFMSGLRIEIGVAAAHIDGAMADAEIGEPHRVVHSDWNVSGDVGHVVVDPGIPFQLEHREQVTKSHDRARDAVET